MKKILSLLLCLAMLLSLTVFAGAEGAVTYYIDSAAGSDNDSGLTEGSALASAAPLAGKTFAPGDSILFKRGGTYDVEFAPQGSGTEQAPITIGAYGDTGAALPLLTTSGTGCVLTLCDLSYWTIKDLEITAPTGTGVLVVFEKAVVKGVTLRDLKVHDVQNAASKTYYAGIKAAVRLQGTAQAACAHLEDVTVDGCEIYDSDYGLNIGGNGDNTAEGPYNKNITIENSYVHETVDDGILMGETDGLFVDNCSVINCSNSPLYYTAPAWFFHIINSTMQNCEIAGSTNYKDGMAIDFDDRTDNTTVQYVYSHDNIRFLWGCMWTEPEHDNTVRYCLSVNDNKTYNGVARLATSDWVTTNFKFYNNTLVNSVQYKFYNYDKSYIQNNIFIMEDGEKLLFDTTQGHTNTVSNNLYYNTSVPSCDTQAYYGAPGFSGSDLSDKNSFILSSSSQLIGKGTQVEEDMGSRDLYGNAVTAGMKHNIGCYEGSGVEQTGSLFAKSQPLDFFWKIYIVFLKIIRWLYSN